MKNELPQTLNAAETGANGGEEVLFPLGPVAASDEFGKACPDGSCVLIGGVAVDGVLTGVRVADSPGQELRFSPQEWESFLGSL